MIHISAEALILTLNLEESLHCPPPPQKRDKKCFVTVAVSIVCCVCWLKHGLAVLTIFTETAEYVGARSAKKGGVCRVGGTMLQKLEFLLAFKAV